MFRSAYSSSVSSTRGATLGSTASLSRPVAGKVRSGRTSALQVVAFKEDEQQKAAKQAAGDKKGSTATAPGQRPEPVFPVPASAPNTFGRQRDVIAMILGGGSTDYDKLFPLTERRALPAVPVAGLYRLVDIPITNCIHSGIHKMYIITQFNSQSLNKYLAQTYNLSTGVPLGGDGFIEVLSTTQYPGGYRWSQGTADAVRQFLWILEDIRNSRTVEDILILPADQLYRADFSWAIEAHRRQGAGLTLLCKPIPESQAEGLGLAQVNCSVEGELEDGGCLITDFQEKPSERTGLVLDPETLSRFHSASASAQQQGSNSPSPSRQSSPGARIEEGSSMYLASTGILIINRQVMVDLLRKHQDAMDFGRDLIPRAVAEGYKVLSLEFPGPWRDVGGSIRDYHAASMELLGESVTGAAPGPRPRAPGSRSRGDDEEDAGFEETAASLVDPYMHHLPLFHAAQALPPTQYNGAAHLSSSIVSPGCRLGEGIQITHSVVGPRSVIGNDVVIEDSVVMGADFFESEEHHNGTGADNASAQAGGATNAAGQEGSSSAEAPNMRNLTPVGIGAGSVIKKAILDKNVAVGRNVRLENVDRLHASNDFAAIGVYIRDGIIVVSKGAVIPDGTCI